MAIIVRLDRVIADRKISLSELAEAIGITLANLSILKTGKARAVRFSTLDGICRFLSCQPGDILEYAPGEGPRAGGTKAGSDAPDPEEE